MKKFLLVLCLSGSWSFGSQIVNPATASSSSGGYALQPATVTIQGNFGVTATTITATSTSTFHNITFSSTSLYGIVGSSLPDSAAAGNVGEYVNSVVPDASHITMTNASTWYNVTSISLTAGDWDVYGVTNITLNATPTAEAGALSLFSGNTTTDHTIGDNVFYTTPPSSNSTSGLVVIPVWRQSLSAATTTVYLKTLCTSAGATASGRLTARRVR